MGIDDVIASVAADMEAQAGVASTVAPPSEDVLWEPLPPEPGRGLLTPDGRRLSPQEMAVETWADELFFGGGPGGGKSFLAIGLAVTRHRASIIFRREFTQVTGADSLWTKASDIIGSRGRSSEGEMIWRDLPGGRVLEFGAAKDMKSVAKYQGRPHDLKCFDELPEFPEHVYRFAIGWLRTDHPGQRVRVVNTGNPPLTEEGQWVIRYWGPWLDPEHPNPAKPGELRWFVVGLDGKDMEVPGPSWGKERAAPVLLGGDPACIHSWAVHLPGRPCSRCGGRMVNPRSRTFIPSSVEDNPAYLRTGYADVLDNLPEPMRTRMRAGNFQAARTDHEFQVFPTSWVLAAQARWKPKGGEGKPLSSVGNDPSRGGKDEFVIAKRYEEWLAPLVVHPATSAPDGPAGAALVFKAIEGDRNVPVCVDIIGSAGSSVYDHLRLLKIDARALNGSKRSGAKDRSGKLRFANKRAEWHWKFREALDPSYGSEIALPPDAQLRSDLCAIRWRPSLRGIEIEDKEKELKPRLGRSPDRGEACIYAFVETTGGFGLLFDDAGGGSTLEEEVAELERQLGLRKP